MTKELLEEAITLFGQDTVGIVREVVEMSDADGAYSMFEDLGQYEHAECVQFLYFKD